jgi:8-oxo-dGTP pyrophosphatase MutT (NUDIX family)
VSDKPEMIIPADRLPPGFADRVADPPQDAAPPRPAATVVLARDGEHAPELLLLRRHRSSGFVPGAWVFPGGRVDDDDAAADLVALLPELPDEPPAAYWLAGIRELFEETGVLLARDVTGVACPDGVRNAEVRSHRDRLLDGSATLLDVLRTLDMLPDTSRMVYCAHWITPVAEPKRYDTRFFIAELPAGCDTAPDERETDAAGWYTAARAVEAFREGELPMVFPTIKTIQRLVGFRTVDDMLERFRSAHVPPVLPRLVRTEDGVGIVLDPNQEEEQA